MGRDPSRAPAALVERQVVALGVAVIELARPADALLGILDHLAPLGDPADGARDGEEHGEHRGRDAHRLQDDAGIEVDVGEDRKSVVEGKRVSVRVDLGGRRIIKKKSKSYRKTSME